MDIFEQSLLAVSILLATAGWIYAAAEQRRLARKTHTFDMLMSSDITSEFSALLDEIDNRARNGPPAPLDIAQIDQPFRRALNFHEFVCAAIRDRTLDEDLVRNTSRTRMLRLYDYSRDFISAQRTKYRNPQAMEHFEWFALRRLDYDGWKRNLMANAPQERLMPIPITMPALSPTMEEGNLAKWHVKVGDKVKPGDVIAEIETDKATMEVEAVDEGVVSKLLVAEGAQGVKVNAVIAELAGEGEAPAKGNGAKAEAPAKVEAKTPSTASPAKAAAQTPTPESCDSFWTPAFAGDTRNNEPPIAVAGQRIKASPLARRLARMEGVDLLALKGSGPHGRIIKADVLKAPKGGAAAKPGAPAAPGSMIEPATIDERVYLPGTFELLPLDAVRKVTARRLTQSFMQVPHFPLTIDLEIDHLLSARVRINEAGASAGVKVSVNDMLIKACGMALMAQPDANASYTDKGIVMHKSAHVSVAVAIRGGLITPVVRDAQTKGLAQIAAEMKDLAARARERKLKPQEYMGGTFSISNLGMFGIKEFASIINQPEGMILSVGAGEKRPVVKDDKVVVATVMTVTLTCDHRVVDGATGAKWLQHFKQFVETPEAMLL